MDIRQDYYATLGIIPNAEDIVVRAAYKALAQHYHPDRYSGVRAEEAQRRMAEINEAYKILSNSTTRQAYDKARGIGAFSAETYFRDSATEQTPNPDPLERDWLIGLRYYPDLADLEKRLSRISWRLGYSFRAYMLEAKNFERRVEIAESIEQEFLRSYFGENPALLKFASHLIQIGHKSAARALNEAVRILGSNVEATRIIEQITSEFDLDGKKAAAAYAAQQVTVKCCPSCRTLNGKTRTTCDRCGSMLLA